MSYQSGLGAAFSRSPPSPAMCPATSLRPRVSPGRLPIARQRLGSQLSSLPWPSFTQGSTGPGNMNIPRSSAALERGRSLIELGVTEQVGIDGRRDVGIRVPELARDDDERDALCEHHACARVSKSVGRHQRYFVVPHEAGAPQSTLESPRERTVVHGTATATRPHISISCRPATDNCDRVPLTQPGCEGSGDRDSARTAGLGRLLDLPHRRIGAGPLLNDRPTDRQTAAAEIHIRPPQARDLASPEARLACRTEHRLGSQSTGGGEEELQLRRIENPLGRLFPFGFGSRKRQAGRRVARDALPLHSGTEDDPQGRHGLDDHATARGPLNESRQP